MAIVIHRVKGFSVPFVSNSIRNYLLDWRWNQSIQFRLLLAVHRAFALDEDAVHTAGQKSAFFARAD